MGLSAKREAARLVTRVRAARECAGATVADCAEIVDTSRFTYTKWESGELTVTANAEATRTALRALERALTAGYDVLLFPEPNPMRRMRILKLLFDAQMVKLRL